VFVVVSDFILGFDGGGTLFGLGIPFGCCNGSGTELVEKEPAW